MKLDATAILNARQTPPTRSFEAGLRGNAAEPIAAVGREASAAPRRGDFDSKLRGLFKTQDSAAPTARTETRSDQSEKPDSNARPKDDQSYGESKSRDASTPAEALDRFKTRGDVVSRADSASSGDVEDADGVVISSDAIDSEVDSQIAAELAADAANQTQSLIATATVETTIAPLPLTQETATSGFAGSSAAGIAKIAAEARLTEAKAAAVDGVDSVATQLQATWLKLDADQGGQGELGSESSAQDQAIAESSDKPSAMKIPVTFTAVSSEQPVPDVASNSAGGSANEAAKSLASPTPVVLGGESGDADEANVARVGRALNTAVNQGGGSVTLRMSPPEMGLVKIQMEVAEGMVRATLTAQSESVRTLLNHRIEQLQSALEKQGLSVDRLEVRVSPQSSSNAQQQNTGQQSFGDRRGAEQSDDGRSRGQYQPQSQGEDRSGERDDDTSHRRRASFREMFERVG